MATRSRRRRSKVEQVVRLSENLTAPAERVLAVTGGSPGRTEWMLPASIVEPVLARATVAGDGGGARLDLEARVSLDLPYFGFLFRRAVRRHIRRQLAHEAACVGARLEDRPEPSEPGRPKWAPPEAMSAHQARALATLGFVLAVTGYCGSLLTQAVDPIAHTFGADDAALGVATAATRVGTLLALAGGILADRIGRRRLVIAATVCACAASLASALAPSLAVLGALQVLVRGGVNLATVVAFIAVTEEAPEGGRAYALAAAGLAGSLGFVLGALLLPVAQLGSEAWRALFAIGGLGLLLVPGLSRRLTESSRFAQLVRREVRGHAGEVVDRIYGGRFALLAATGFLLNMFFAPTSQFTNRYLSVERGYTETGILLLRAATQALPALIAVWAGGRVAESRGRRPAAIAGLLVMAVTDAIFFLTSGFTLGVTLLVSTAAAALAAPALASFNTEMFPTEVRGTAGGSLLIASVAGSVAGLLLAGYLAGPLGSIGRAIALTAVAPLLVGLFLIPHLPEAKGKALDEISPPEV
ncbi:MAG TPA: MFS transporter [Actinomycetota bacterium]|nr:MFS transporter [Actinomycetota bacterium]